VDGGRTGVVLVLRTPAVCTGDPSSARSHRRRLPLPRPRSKPIRPGSVNSC